MASGVRSPGCGVELELDIPHVWAEELLALDMDRTVVDSDKCARRLEEISGRSFSDYQEEVESGGGTFQPMEDIQRSLSETEFTTLAQRFMAGNPNEYTFSDTATFLTRLGGAVAAPNIVITYGTSPVWQALKTYLSGYRGYLEVMDDPNKGPHIEEWRGPSGTFDFVGMNISGEPKAIYHTRQVKLVDDKAIAFSELPKDTCGAYLKRPGVPALKSQGTQVAKSVRSRVTSIRSLADLRIHNDLRASCHTDNLPHQIQDITVFRPLYYGTKPKPGIIIKDAMSSTAIEDQLRSMYVT